MAKKVRFEISEDRAKLEDANTKWFSKLHREGERELVDKGQEWRPLRMLGNCNSDSCQNALVEAVLDEVLTGSKNIEGEHFGSYLGHAGLSKTLKKLWENSSNFKEQLQNWVLHPDDANGSEANLFRVLIPCFDASKSATERLELLQALKDTTNVLEINKANKAVTTRNTLLLEAASVTSVRKAAPARLNPFYMGDIFAEEMGPPELNFLSDFALALRGLLGRGLFVYALSRRKEVNFGPRMDGPKATTNAVPFRAAQSPAPAAEFSQPDMAQLFTEITYYQDGLSYDQFVALIKFVAGDRSSDEGDSDEGEEESGHGEDEAGTAGAVEHEGVTEQQDEGEKIIVGWDETRLWEDEDCSAGYVARFR